MRIRYELGDIGPRQKQPTRASVALIPAGPDQSKFDSVNFGLICHARNRSEIATQSVEIGISTKGLHLVSYVDPAY
jgi:hypothetical protein